MNIVVTTYHQKYKNKPILEESAIILCLEIFPVVSKENDAATNYGKFS